MIYAGRIRFSRRSSVSKRVHCGHYVASISAARLATPAVCIKCTGSYTAAAICCRAPVVSCLSSACCPPTLFSILHYLRRAWCRVYLRPNAPQQSDALTLGRCSSQCSTVLRTRSGQVAQVGTVVIFFIKTLLLKVLRLFVCFCVCVQWSRLRRVTCTWMGTQASAAVCREWFLKTTAPKQQQQQRPHLRVLLLHVKPDKVCFRLFFIACSHMSGFCDALGRITSECCVHSPRSPLIVCCCAVCMRAPQLCRPALWHTDQPYPMTGTLLRRLCVHSDYG